MSNDYADLSKLPDIQKTEVKVNGKKTPLSIGDKIRLSDNDINIKTVVAIQVFEDQRIVYTLEWVENDSEFKQELVTLSELKLLKENLYSRPKVTIS